VNWFSSAVCTEEHIDGWIANPKALLPASTMALAFPFRAQTSAQTSLPI
jgi:hypothetical protein